MEDLDRSHFPSTDWFNYASIRPQALAIREAVYAVCCGSTGDTDFGNPADVEREVDRRLDHFSGGGLILGPSHKIQPNSPLENILAMYRTAGSLLESIPREIYELSDSDQLPFTAYRGTKIVIPAS